MDEASSTPSVYPDPESGSNNIAQKTQNLDKEQLDVQTEEMEHDDTVEPSVASSSFRMEEDVNEDETSATGSGRNPEQADTKNTSSDSIIWLEHTSTMPDNPDGKRECRKQPTPPSCQLSNDEDVEMGVEQVSDVAEKATSDDAKVVGESSQKLPVHNGEEKVNPNKLEDSVQQTPTNVKCCNTECSQSSEIFMKAPLFALNSYDLNRRKKDQYICEECFNASIQQYGQLGGLLTNNQPLLSYSVQRRNDLVEIDSSDEESEAAVGAEFSKESISLLELELNQVINKMIVKYNVAKNVKDSIAALQNKLTSVEDSCWDVSTMLKVLRKNLDDMQHNLYGCVRTGVKELPPFSIVDDHSMLAGGIHANKTPLLEREPVILNAVYFAMRGTLLGDWIECKVIEEVKEADAPVKYLVQFLQGDLNRAVVGTRQMAYSTPSTGRLQQGMRIIAKVDNSELASMCEEFVDDGGDCYYAGIIAETLSSYNGHRYLVIFDNGYTYYALPWNVRVVCEQSENVWEDVDPHSQEFVRGYLNNYKSVRPMVQVKKGQRMMTEKDGRWLLSVVLKTDSSLVLLHFPEIKTFEWIFRGSKRLGPLYHDRKKERQISKFQKRNIPSIEYITIVDDDDDIIEDVTVNNLSAASGSEIAGPSTSRTPTSPVASTSTATVASPPDSKAALAHLRNAPATPSRRTAPTGLPQILMMNKNIIYCDNDRPEGTTNNFTVKNYRGPAQYVPHECSPRCILPSSFDLKTYNLLARPLIDGWERQYCKARNKKTNQIVYRGPCGRRLRYMYELHKYLRITKAPFNVENFDFDPENRALASFKAENLIYEIKDLSNGKELMPVSCVNYYDDTRPPPCEYSTQRIPTEGVNLNLDDDFLCCCDCEDDCFDKSRCQCWQMTILGALRMKPDTPIDDIGYVYKRLDELVLTGIFECNSRCRCKVNECLNRVVQHPLQTKLQVFKTSNRGWGIRCLNDVPKGSFICIYTGHLLTEEASNLICEQNADKTGDEYFADLDYIETVEEVKDGYESEAIEPLWDSSESDDEQTGPDTEAANATQDSDDDYTSNIKPTTKVKVVNTRAKMKEKKSKTVVRPPVQVNKRKPGVDRERVNLIPKSLMDTVDSPGPDTKRRSIRQLFGENEHPYVMDAKKTGNLGRYFNHSCNPNLFVQNVFVDTHDLRFPWVAFFANRNIRAGSELTWNYSYDVGSVPGKILFCHCGEPKCRKRLL